MDTCGGSRKSSCVASAQTNCSQTERELKLTLEQIQDIQLATKNVNINLSSSNNSNYDKEFSKWMQNVDKGYAWVVLIALWVIVSATMGPYRVYGLIYAKVTSEEVYTREEATWPVSTIFTVENVFGPIVSIVAYHISFRSSMLIGAILTVLGNSLSTFSSSLILDVFLIGFVQGIGYSFMSMPYMEVINSWFYKYRSMALGISLCGGTLAIFALQPLFQWMLQEYPWRYSYMGIGLVSAITLIIIPLLKQNPQPKQPLAIEVYHNDKSGEGNGGKNQLSTKIKKNEETFLMIWEIVVTPAFHMIWFCELLYFWIFSIIYLVIIDYAIDRDCTIDEAESLQSYQSIGEFIGRLILPILVDKRFTSNKNVCILNLSILASLLILITQVSGYIWMASLAVAISAFLSVLYILLNALLVDYLGERKVTLGYGSASCIAGILMSLRPQAVGFCRDYLKTYDPLMIAMAVACAFGALMWLLEPLISKRFLLASKKSSQVEAEAGGGGVEDKCKHLNQ